MGRTSLHNVSYRTLNDRDRVVGSTRQGRRNETWLVRATAPRYLPNSLARKPFCVFFFLVRINRRFEVATGCFGRSSSTLR